MVRDLNDENPLHCFKKNIALQSTIHVNYCKKKNINRTLCRVDACIIILLYPILYAQKLDCWKNPAVWPWPSHAYLHVIILYIIILRFSVYMIINIILNVFEWFCFLFLYISCYNCIRIGIIIYNTVTF